LNWPWKSCQTQSTCSKLYSKICKLSMVRSLYHTVKRWGEYGTVWHSHRTFTILKRLIEWIYTRIATQSAVNPPVVPSVARITTDRTYMIQFFHIGNLIGKKFTLSVGKHRPIFIHRIGKISTIFCPIFFTQKMSYMYKQITVYAGVVFFLYDWSFPVEINPPYAIKFLMVRNISYKINWIVYSG
jgi:hypothetical protein